jgi:competence protein ComEC
MSQPASWRPIDDLVQARIDGGVRYPQVAVGDEVELAGALESPASRPDAEFDYAGYLRRSGVHAIMRADAIRATGRRRGGPAGLVDRLRRRAEVGVGAGLAPVLAALAQGIVLGQDERIPADVADQFKDSGLAHLLSVTQLGRP